MSITFRLPRPTVASQLKRAGPIAAALIAALVLVPTASAGNYTDASGDNGSAGDITGVTIAADKASGQILFRITGTNVSTTPDVPTFLLIDSDANPVTGDIGSIGADYLFAVDDKSYWFAHWTGSTWADTPDITVRVTGGGAALLISVNRSELGNASAFNFCMFWSFDSVGQKWDNAPDDGAFNYSIDLNGPDIRSIDLQTSPAAGPRAGKKFVVTPAALKLPPNGAVAFDVSQAPESYSCTASLAKHALPETGKGGCTLAIPNKSRGKTLSVRVTVNYQGAAKAFTYTFKVR